MQHTNLEDFRSQIASMKLSAKPVANAQPATVHRYLKDEDQAMALGTVLQNDGFQFNTTSTTNGSGMLFEMFKHGHGDGKKTVIKVYTKAWHVYAIRIDESTLDAFIAKSKEI